MPDVFYFPQVQSGSISSDTDYNALYPINFAMHRFPSQYVASGLPLDFVLPLGTGGAPAVGVLRYGYEWRVLPRRWALYKHLGMVPQQFLPSNVPGMMPVQPAGYDGIDNGGQPGFIDDFGEGVDANPAKFNNQATVREAIANHQHKTARAEMLYALLVESRGPLGSVFNADDFTNREVQDTDHDGLPEFVDSWGEPLYFYRWPLYFSSEVQKGLNRYSQFDTRDQNPLDPGQQLLAPAWWSKFNNGPGLALPSSPFGTMNQVGAGAVVFETYFHPLHDPTWDPNANQTANPNNWLWDRGNPSSPTNFTQRRAFYSKFLIVSSGPDKELGIKRLDTYNQPLSVNNLMLESMAIPITNTTLAGAIPSMLDPEAWQDDIVSHDLRSSGAVQ